VAHEQTLTLPLQVTSPVDVGRLQRELESIDGSLTQAALRKDGSKPTIPKTTTLMDNMLQLNKINLANSSERKPLMDFLVQTKAKAPVLHMSFSADPSTTFIDRLLTWLRQEIHPNLLVTIGLQPNIGAGCIVRSTNKYFDFSLRQDFASKRGLLLEKLDQIMITLPEDSATASESPESQKSQDEARLVAAGSQAVHDAPQPTAKLMTPAGKSVAPQSEMAVAA
jgi:hypothetical protein